MVLSFWGVSRLCEQGSLDTLGLPVWSAIRPMSRSLSVTNGKALSHAMARTGAMMEAIECACAEDSERLTGVNTPPFNGFDPARVLSIRKPGNLYSAPRSWVAGKDIIAQTPVALPFECVGLDDRMNTIWDHKTFAMSSIGLAAHWTYDDAVLAATLEVIEHDALALAQMPGRFDGFPRLEPRSLTEPKVCELIDQLERAGQSPELVDITNDIGIPCVFCLLRDMGAPSPRAKRFAGLACRLTYLDAAKAALFEAVQSRATDIAGARDDITYADFDRLQGAEHPPYPPIQIPDTPTSQTEPLAWLKARLASVGCDALWVFNLSHPAQPISCVKAVIPGLELSTIGGLKLRIGVRGRQTLLREVLAL
ncbi:YcaO-like family protein [Octadecabacter sp.]|nr:YcaO-like family protein [Octadecabacter sp.]